MSCSKLDENGHEIRFESGKCTLRPAHEEGFFKIRARSSGVYQLGGTFQTQENYMTANRSLKGCGTIDLAILLSQLFVMLLEREPHGELS